MPPDEDLRLNELAAVKPCLVYPLIYDGYDENRYSGSFILINEYTNQTVETGVLNTELVWD